MKTLSIDIETYSDQNLAKTGVYRYVESPVFEILLFSYSVDGGPVQLVDLACGEIIPVDIIAALEDDAVTKWAFNVGCEDDGESNGKTARRTAVQADPARRENG